MTITTAAFAKLLWPGLNAVYGKKYNEYSPEWSMIFDKYTSKQAFEEDVGVTGFGLPSQMDEGDSVTYDDMEQGFVTRYTHVMYSLGFIITYQMYKNNLYAEVGLKRAESLAFSMRTGKETVHANVLNRAFNSSYTGGDGKELCATDHPNKSGGTWRNELSTAADLSETALEQACTDIEAIENDRGNLIKLIPKALIIPPGLKFDATRILKSTLQSGTANNDVNALRTMGSIPDIVINHYLTDPDAWFIKTDCPHGLKSFQREPMKFDTDNDFDTRNARFAAFDWFSVKWSDPRAIFGSPGA